MPIVSANWVDMLVNRVRKNRRKLKAWIKRDSVRCYRLYDRDIPEIPMAVDWYDGALHASVYQRKRPFEADQAQQVLVGLGAALGVAEQNCYLKTRKRQKGRRTISSARRRLRCACR